ncbi:MAG: hypothetical protein IJK04_09305 [Kiritimatiellae bacterium]|nr:hypothetical protein [Kiritimatiellia bacterium]
MHYGVPNDATFAAVLVFALFAAVLAVIAERTHFFPRAVRWIQKDPVVRTALVALLFAIGPITARTKNGQLSLPRPPLLLQVDEPAPEPAIVPVTVHTNGVALRVESMNAVEVTAFRTIGGTELGDWKRKFPRQRRHLTKRVAEENVAAGEDCRAMNQASGMRRAEGPSLHA